MKGRKMKKTFTFKLNNDRDREDYQSMITDRLNDFDNVIYYSSQLNDMPEELKGEQEGYYDCISGDYEFIGTKEEIMKADRFEFHDETFIFEEQTREEYLLEKYGLISDINVAICESYESDKVVKFMTLDKFTDKFINKAVKSGFTAKQAKFLSQVCFDV